MARILWFLSKTIRKCFSSEEETSFSIACISSNSLLMSVCEICQSQSTTVVDESGAIFIEKSNQEKLCPSRQKLCVVSDGFQSGKKLEQSRYVENDQEAARSDLHHELYIGFGNIREFSAQNTESGKSQVGSCCQQPLSLEIGCDDHPQKANAAESRDVSIEEALDNSVAHRTQAHDLFLKSAKNSSGCVAVHPARRGLEAGPCCMVCSHSDMAAAVQASVPASITSPVAESPTRPAPGEPRAADRHPAGGPRPPEQARGAYAEPAPVAPNWRLLRAITDAANDLAAANELAAAAAADAALDAESPR